MSRKTILDPKFPIDEFKKGLDCMQDHLATIAKVNELFSNDSMKDEIASASTLLAKGQAVVKEGMLLHLFATIEDDGELRKALNRMSKQIPDSIQIHILPLLWETVQSKTSLKRKKVA